MSRAKTPQFYYNQQKQHTAARSRERVSKGLSPIEWRFTFEEWWAIWEQSGKWKQRGCTRGKYGMARHGDMGHYEPGNVSIEEHGKNSRDGITGWPAKKRAREDRAAAERANEPTRVESPRTLPSSPDCTCGKEVEDSETYIENAARIFLENGQRYGQPQPDASNRIVDISSRKSSKQSNAKVSIAKSSKNPDGEREIGLSLIKKMGEMIILLKSLFEINYNSQPEKYTEKDYYNKQKENNKVIRPM